MFDPEADLTAIWHVLSKDQKLLDLLGYTSGPISTVIYKGDESPYEVEKRLCFYHVPSRSTVNELCSIEVVQFDAHVPFNSVADARRIQKRIVEIVSRNVFNGHKFYFMGQLGNLPTAENYTCIGSRYRYTIVV